LDDAPTGIPPANRTPIPGLGVPCLVH